MYTVERATLAQGNEAQKQGDKSRRAPPQGEPRDPERRAQARDQELPKADRPEREGASRCSGKLIPPDERRL